LVEIGRWAKARKHSQRRVEYERILFADMAELLRTISLLQILPIGLGNDGLACRTCFGIRMDLIAAPLG